MPKNKGIQDKQSVVSSSDIAKELAGVFLDKDFFVLRDPKNAKHNTMAEKILSLCQTFIQADDDAYFLETTDSFKSFLDEEAFDNSYGKRHTFKEISEIILDAAQGKPFVREKDILLVWDNLDKFSPEVADSLKLSLKENLREIIQKQARFDDRDNSDIFVKGLLKGLENDKKAYPMVDLNPDGSVSVYLDTDWEANTPAPTEENYDKTKHESYIFASCAYKDEKELRDNFSALFSNPAFIMSLEHAVDRHGFDTINGAPLIEMIHNDSIDVDQFKINISPENLDSILKEQWRYVGYRNDGSLLDLYPHHELKPGKMMLAPVAAIDEEFALRITGCQVTEVPSIQLLDILPDHHGEKIGKYHWDVKEVVESLSLDRAQIENTLNTILVNGGALETALHHNLTGGEGSTIISPPEEERTSLRVVPMDEVSKRFYAQFGQCTMEELANCQSLEVDTIEFLQASVQEIDKHVKRVQERARESPSSRKAIEKATQGREMLQVLIAKEKELASGGQDKETIGKWTSTMSGKSSEPHIANTFSAPYEPKAEEEVSHIERLEREKDKDKPRGGVLL